MLTRLLSSTSISPKQVLTISIAAFLVVASLSFGSYYWSEKQITARRGPIAIIPKEAREVFLVYRTTIGAGAAGLFVIIGAGWFGAERLSRTWQKERNEELAKNAVLLRLAPRVDEKSKWTAAADLWGAIHSTLVRSNWQTWLGAGMHISLEVVQEAGERLAFYLWTPRPLAETLVRQLRATYSGLEIETMIKSDKGAPTNEINDYLDRVPPEAAWLWADLGLSGDPWRPLRTDFSGDPLPSLLSPLEGLSPGNSLAAIHFVLRPAAGGWQSGGQAFVSKLRGIISLKDSLAPRFPLKIGT